VVDRIFYSFPGQKGVEVTNSGETGSGRWKVAEVFCLLPVETEEKGDKDPGAINQKPGARN